MNKEDTEVTLQHAIGGTAWSDEIGIIMRQERKAIEIVQNGKTITIDKWQALELAKELLNNRDYLKRITT